MRGRREGGSISSFIWRAKSWRLKIFNCILKMIFSFKPKEAGDGVITCHLSLARTDIEMKWKSWLPWQLIISIPGTHDLGVIHIWRHVILDLFCYPLPPSSRYLVIRLCNCRHKILATPSRDVIYVWPFIYLIILSS